VKKKKQEDLEVSSDSSGNIDEEEGEAINKN